MNLYSIQKRIRFGYRSIDSGYYPHGIYNLISLVANFVRSGTACKKTSALDVIMNGSEENLRSKGKEEVYILFLPAMIYSCVNILPKLLYNNMKQRRVNVHSTTFVYHSSQVGSLTGQSKASRHSLEFAVVPCAELAD
jgi:hypothetical protein